MAIAAMNAQRERHLCATFFCCFPYQAKSLRLSHFRPGKSFFKGCPWLRCRLPESEPSLRTLRSWLSTARIQESNSSPSGPRVPEANLGRSGISGTRVPEPCVACEWGFEEDGGEIKSESSPLYFEREKAAQAGMSGRAKRVHIRCTAPLTEAPRCVHTQTASSAHLCLRPTRTETQDPSTRSFQAVDRENALLDKRLLQRYLPGLPRSRPKIRTQASRRRIAEPLHGDCASSDACLAGARATRSSGRGRNRRAPTVPVGLSSHGAHGAL